jgi:hypothetical protein
MKSRWLPLVGVGLVGSTLLTVGIDGVTRWHRVGPLQLHCSALLVPLLLVVAAGVVRAQPIAVGLMLVACQLVHLAQPDAGQATALGAAAAWVLMRGTTSPVARGLGVASALCGALVWLRPDPLPPAPFVEDIVAVAFRVTPLVGVVSMLSLLAIALAPLVVVSAPTADPTVKHARIGLALYLAGTIVVPIFGEFPVPLLGFGPSPIVGTFLGLAALQIMARPARATTDDAAPTPSKPRGPSHQGVRTQPLHSGANQSVKPALSSLEVTVTDVPTRGFLMA